MVGAIIMPKNIKKKTGTKNTFEEKLIEEPPLVVEDELTKFKLQIGPARLTKYERARIIGARALQISMSAPILLSESESSNMKDPIQIAEKELEGGLLPITIRRKLPNGQFEDIPLKYLLNHN